MALERNGYITIPEDNVPEMIEGELSTDNKSKVTVAVFDFDGTSIQGNSPVILVRYLALRGMLRKSVVMQILLWGGAYKVRLPQNESWVRQKVFTAFKGRSVKSVNEFLQNFYHERIKPRFRPQSEAEMMAHAAEGHVVIWVSASFEPIILEAMRDHPYVSYQISTRMEIHDGYYTNKVEGLPIEGSEKLVALTKLCDDLYGKDGWELGYAYGDHHSDRTVLQAARHAYAVTPDRPLTRLAKARGWEILDWDISLRQAKKSE